MRCNLKGSLSDRSKIPVSGWLTMMWIRYKCNKIKTKLKKLFSVLEHIADGGMVKRKRIPKILDCLKKNGMNGGSQAVYHREVFLPWVKWMLEKQATPKKAAACSVSLCKHSIKTEPSMPIPSTICCVIIDLDSIIFLRQWIVWSLVVSFILFISFIRYWVEPRCACSLFNHFHPQRPIWVNGNR